jgi:hypothetical protein
LRRLRPPSTGTAIGLLALSIAVTGTAFAATGQLVNIADGTTAANVAKVDPTGALNTTNVPSRNQFREFAYAYDGLTTITPTTSASLALDRVVISQAGDNGAGHNNAAVTLYVRGASAGNCNGSLASTIGAYNVHANDTVVDNFTVPMRLKAPAGSTQYCIAASSSVFDTAGQGVWLVPRVTISGHVLSGTYSGTIYNRSAKTGPGALRGIVENGKRR